MYFNDAKPDEQIKFYTETELDNLVAEYKPDAPVAEQPAQGAPVAEQPAPTEVRAEGRPAEQPAAEEGAEPQPIGRGIFGNIYNQFKGKVKEAVNFLLGKQEGVAQAVFHREGLGDIDLAWGDNRFGLKHIIERHVIEQSDFNSVDEAVAHINDVINNGNIVEHGDDVLILKDGYKVVLSKAEDGHFIITAYDTARAKNEKRRSDADATLFRQSIFGGGMEHPVSPGIEPSDGKVSALSSEKQAKGQESLQGATEKSSSLSEGEISKVDKKGVSADTSKIAPVAEQPAEGAVERKGIINVTEMGDEDRESRGNVLKSAQAVDVNENSIVSQNGLTLRKSAENWWQSHFGEPLFYETEVGEVEINLNSVKDSLSHRYSQAKLDAITGLAEGFENAVYLGSMEDFTRHGGVMNHYFAFPINYKGQRRYVFCRAMQDANKNRLYEHEVFVADTIKKGNTLQTAASQPHGGIALYRDILANVLETKSEAEPQQSKKGVAADDTAGQPYEESRAVVPNLSANKGNTLSQDKQGNGAESSRIEETMSPAQEPTAPAAPAAGTSPEGAAPAGMIGTGQGSAPAEKTMPTHLEAVQALTEALNRNGIPVVMWSNTEMQARAGGCSDGLSGSAKGCV